MQPVLGETGDSLSRMDSRWFGPLLEGYVVGEVAKQAGWSDRPLALGHYRDRQLVLADRLVAAPVATLWA